jgi:hypothetical protein
MFRMVCAVADWLGPLRKEGALRMEPIEMHRMNRLNRPDRPKTWMWHNGFNPAANNLSKAKQW